MSYLEISTSPAEIRSLGDQIALNGADLAKLASAANSEHDQKVGPDMSVFGNDDLGKQFKPTYRGTPASTGVPGFDATNAGQFFASMKQIGDELGDLGGGLRSAIDTQMGAELDNDAEISKINPPA
ncbi:MULTISPECIES: hypothetical protein [Amycolatopsis]|uniref:Uncharacterized protein n=1 Tax=Amycolatopsis thermalba TaxID=944492 RepID=A0ABY4NUB1_9PSEU|nr:MULTISPECIES: hypothetical protein [Amycolatopsis]OXM72876.1 hypothetical protein CF166_12750 [Amycolatopsis sp. KNN50.9b]UQS23659.1 hypothetical protein L1857_12900 [Amycolatopsis thermalba]